MLELKNKNTFQWDAYHPHITIWGVSLAETPLDRDPPDRDLPLERDPLWTETPPREQNHRQV